MELHAHENPTNILLKISVLLTCICKTNGHSDWPYSSSVRGILNDHRTGLLYNVKAKNLSSSVRGLREKMFWCFFRSSTKRHVTHRAGPVLVSGT